MAGPNYVLDKGFTAGGAITKYNTVELGASEVVTQNNAQGEAVIGVCQEEVSAADATNGRVVDVRLLGISRCVVTTGASITIGAEVTTNSGTVEAAATSDLVLGVALQAVTTAAAGHHIDVLLTQSRKVVA